MSNRPLVRKIDVDEVREQLDRLSRDPFRDLLANILGASPTPEVLRLLAQKNPDRWGQLLAIVGRLSGFTERLEVEGNITTKLSGMSDLELEQRLAELGWSEHAPAAPAAPAKAPARRPRQRRSKLVLVDPPQDGEQADD